MDKINVVKTALKFVAGASASYVTTQIIKNNIRPENALQQTEAIVGGFVIGGMVAHHAEEYTSKLVDEVVDAFNRDKKN